MKIEFSSQRRVMLLFLTTNMAAVTSRANQQLVSAPLDPIQLQNILGGATQNVSTVTDTIY